MKGSAVPRLVAVLVLAALTPLAPEPRSAGDAARLEARARHSAEGEGATYIALAFHDDPSPGDEPVGLRSLDGPSVYLVPARAARAEDPAVFLARTEARLPERFAVDSGGKSQAFTVDWSGVEDDPALPETWRESAREHFERLQSTIELRAFCRYALDRLRRGDRDPSREPDFLRAQVESRWRSTFDLTTGAVAIEESLQLERLRGTGRDRSLPAGIPISSVEGVTIEAHPWVEMLDGRDPEPDPIERFLPLDQYAFEARSFEALLELADWVDAHGTLLLDWNADVARDARVRERLERQICLPASFVARKLGPFVIERIAATGGDPFLREGSDLTVVFETKSPSLLLANLEVHRKAAEERHADTKRIEEEYHGHAIRGVVTPLREVSSWSTTVEKYVLVSNSRVGLRRALDAHDGRIESQDEGLDRKFVRTLLPRSEAEAAFLFLSDPAIRRLVSPGLKLRENRRLECSMSLRTIAHAALWRAVRGAPEDAGSVEDLVSAGDLSPDLLYCPDGGTYSLLAGGRTGMCTVHGTLDFLTPNAELRLDRITSEEDRAYGVFRRTYQNYWTRFFDPIGIQVSFADGVDGARVRRVETVILPLIEMSEYRQLADLFGGEGVQRGPAVESAPGTAALFSAHINRESWLFREGEGFLRSASPGLGLGWIGDRISVFLRDAPEGFTPRMDRDLLEGMLSEVARGYPGGARIAVENRLLLATFLTGMRALIQSSAPGAVSFQTLPERRGVSIVRVAPQGDFASERGPEALYYAIAGDGLYLSFDQRTVEEVIDRQGESPQDEGSTSKDGDRAAGGAEQGPETREPRTPEPAGKVASSWIDGSHIAIGIDLRSAPRWRELLAELHRRRGLEMCAESVRLLQELERLGARSEKDQRLVLGALPRCPLGGELRRTDDGSIVCSRDESPGAVGAHPLADLDWVRASLRFTEDGVRTWLEFAEKR